jgi:thioredoxin 1
MVAEITTWEELEKISRTHPGLIVIDFYAQWCGPCKKMMPFLQELAGAFSDVQFLKVDIERAPTLAEYFKVSSMPTILFIKQAEIKATIIDADLAGVYETLQKYH